MPPVLRGGAARGRNRIQAVRAPLRQAGALSHSERKIRRAYALGRLTGIRPTKLAYTEKEAGRDFVALFEKMGVREENIALVADVLKAQEGIYEKRDGNSDLFVSLPFCPTK